MPDVDLAKFAARCAINPPGQYEGPAIASAATVTLSNPVHKITGTVSITVLNPPYPGFVGHVTLVCIGAVPLATGGNIASAVAGVASKIIQLYYDGAVWYPDKA